MSRYSPTVLPEPNYSFATALSGLERGYGLGQSIIDTRRKRQEEDEALREHEEDRNRYLQQLRGAEEAQPGAEPLSSYLQEPGYKKQVDVAATKAQPASAGGRLIFAPHFARDLYQEPTSGAVVSRTAARQQTLADVMARSVPDYIRAGVSSPEELTKLDLARNPQRLATKLPARLMDPGTGQVYERQPSGEWAPATMATTPAGGGKPAMPGAAPAGGPAAAAPRPFRVHPTLQMPPRARAEVPRPDYVRQQAPTIKKGWEVRSRASHALLGYNVPGIGRTNDMAQVDSSAAAEASRQYDAGQRAGAAAPRARAAAPHRQARPAAGGMAPDGKPKRRVSQADFNAIKAANPGVADIANYYTVVSGP